jgi:hypothetical protein
VPKSTGPKPPVEAITHARGHLTGVAPGILEGTVEFPVRGTKAFQMRRMPNDRIGECAKLICIRPYSECALVLIETIDEPTHWWGQIPIEGYHFFVRAMKDGKRMAIEFLDCKQPFYPTLEQSRAAVGEAA